MKDSELKKEIMERVKTIYWFRKLIHPIKIKTAILAVGFFGVFSMVSVSNVVNNLRSESLSNYFSYIYNAFISTELAVQLTLSTTLIVALWVLFDVVFKLKNSLKFRTQ